MNVGSDIRPTITQKLGKEGVYKPPPQSLDSEYLTVNQIKFFRVCTKRLRFFNHHSLTEVKLENELSFVCFFLFLFFFVFFISRAERSLCVAVAASLSLSVAVVTAK